MKNADHRLSSPLGLLVALLLGVTGCAAEMDDSPDHVVVGIEDGFAAWRDSLPLDETTGYYVVEGDMLMPEDKLRAYYDQNAGVSNALILHTVGSQPVTQYVWDSSTRRNLTFCLSQRWFDMGAATKEAVRLAVINSGNAWSAATNNEVVFRHVPSEDGARCTNANNNVLFNVEVNDGTHCGGANCGFFPDGRDWPRAKRVLYFNTAFPLEPVPNQNAIATHELGHILGFGHEQSWFRGTALECAPRESLEPSFLALTRFDNNSVMHYGGCPTSGPNAGWQLTTYDIRGAQCAYRGLCEWIQLAGANSVRDIDVDAFAHVWSVSNVLKDGEGYYLQAWNHSTLRWETHTTPTGAQRVSVDPGGLPWYTTSSGKIYRARNGRVELFPGGAKDISIGANGAVWAVTNQPVNGGFKIAKLSGTSWIIQTGIFGNRISVDRNGAPFVVQPDGTIYHLESGRWNQWPGSAFDIDAGSDGSLWAIARDGTIWQWVVNHWELVTGAAQGIAVAQNGQPWVVGYSNETFINRWVP